ncbi:hypothetical protein AcW1_008629 [Taiwanofungus camphoratus]|nr:hypothetical protein AcV5_006648 [Antrodia cinnamomea]KAI0948884.1 hypothetical protein AcW1_008629 [Antrodia cinnamomea]
MPHGISRKWSKSARTKLDKLQAPIITGRYGPSDDWCYYSPEAWPKALDLHTIAQTLTFYKLTSVLQNIYVSNV